MTSRARSLSVLPLTLSLILTLSACNAKDAVATGLVALQGAAITANQTVNQSTGQPLLSDADAMKVVRYSTQALVTLQASASGWQVTLKTGWAAFEVDLSASVKTQFKTQLAVVDGAIGAL